MQRARDVNWSLSTIVHHVQASMTWSCSWGLKWYMIDHPCILVLDKIFIPTVSTTRFTDSCHGIFPWWLRQANVACRERMAWSLEAEVSKGLRWMSPRTIDYRYQYASIDWFFRQVLSMFFPPCPQFCIAPGRPRRPRPPPGFVSQFSFSKMANQKQRLFSRDDGCSIIPCDFCTIKDSTLKITFIWFWPFVLRTPHIQHFTYPSLFQVFCEGVSPQLHLLMDLKIVQPLSFGGSIKPLDGGSYVLNLGNGPQFHHTSSYIYPPWN